MQTRHSRDSTGDAVRNTQLRGRSETGRKPAAATQLTSVTAQRRESELKHTAG